MTRLTTDVVTDLEAIAWEIRELFSERGHHVEQALDIDSAFRHGNRPRSSLAGSLIQTGFTAGGSATGLAVHTGPGGCLQIYLELGNAFAVIRLLRAKTARGRYKILANGSASWSTAEEEALIPEYRFVFGYVLDEEGLGDIFVAEVTGWTPGSPGELILGDPVLLGDGGGASRGFSTDHDDTLPGLGDEDDSDELFA